MKIWKKSYVEELEKAIGPRAVGRLQANLQAVVVADSPSSQLTELAARVAALEALHDVKTPKDGKRWFKLFENHLQAGKKRE